MRFVFFGGPSPEAHQTATVRLIPKAREVETGIAVFSLRLAQADKIDIDSLGSGRAIRCKCASPVPAPFGGPQFDKGSRNAQLSTAIAGRFIFAVKTAS